MNTLTRRDLVAAVVEATGCSHRTAQKAVRAVVDTVEEALSSAQAVEIRPLGRFVVTLRPGFTKSMPDAPGSSNTKLAKIPRRAGIVFRPTKSLRRKATRALKARRK